MALRHIDSAPKVGDFTPLQEHQEQTPSTFFGAKPVLYAHQSGLSLSVSATKLQDDPAFANFSFERDGESEDVLVKDVDVWVNSENLILFQNSLSPTGVSIPYPSIALHATMKFRSTIPALLVNISLNDAETVNTDEDIDTLEIIVLPPGYATDSPPATCIQDIYTAMNACADLHPDPEGDEDGEEDLTAPGATGWITADNMDEYLDEDGNFRGTVIGNEELGPGAGTVRPREGEDEASGADNVNGHEEKYQRTG